MRSRAVLAAILFCCASIAFAQTPTFSLTPPDATPKVTIEGSIHQRTGDEVTGTITAKILEHWHINSARPLAEFAIPTVLELDASTADLVSAQYPAHQLKAFDFTNGEKLAVYEGTILIPFVARVKPDTKVIRASLRYQACDNQVCLPPRNATADIDVTKKTAAAVPSAGFTPLTDAPKGAKARPALFSKDIGGTFAARGLPLTLLVIFVFGVALNLTPCVYPLIPITVGYFSNQSGGSRGQRAALSITYVLGLALTYSALGVFSALSGRIFGAWLQHPGVLVFFAVLMLVMASSMFGLWEIRVPRFIADRSGGRAGLAGALTMGLLIGIVAAPCVGPFVISLIALVSQLASPFLGFLMFFVLALGLGMPYLFLGIFSSGISALPRAGAWMVSVKKAMGFVLIAMAIYFLRPLLGEDVFRWGVAVSLLVGAGFLFFSRTQGAKVMRLACAVLLLAGGVAFAIPRSGGAVVQWDRYDAKSLSAAASANMPVIVDFYADWCLPCKQLDDQTFSDPAVAKEMQRFVRVKADLTAADDPTTIQLTKEYGIVGVPTIVFLKPGGGEITELRLTGFEPPVKFLERLRQVR